MIHPLPEIILPGRGIKRTLHSQVLQSPLAGVSDKVFRKLVRRWAPDSLVFTEMISANSLGKGHGLCKVEELCDEEGPVGVQLFDHRPEAMVEAARKAEGSGAFLIDINMGCPVKKIARKGGGSALLKDPNLAARIVSDISNAVKIPVSVKTRLGWCEASKDTISFALTLQEAGAQLLTLHGRTRAQGFSGCADWEAIAEVKRAVKVPVIANGDITNPDDAFRCLKTTKADGIMIGRGSMGAPWLVGQIQSALNGEIAFKQPSAIERVQLALEQLEELLVANGNHGLFIARKHITWTCQGFHGSSSLCKAFNRATTAKEAKAILQKQISLLNERK